MDRSLNIKTEELILQYLKENGLNRSLLVLQEESGVPLNSVSNIESLLQDVQNGRWNQVLDTIDTMKLSQDTLYLLYDQIVRELVDLRELKLASLLLENAVPLLKMREEDPNNYHRLQELAGKRPNDTKEIYAGISAEDSHQYLTKDKRRQRVAEALSNDIEVVSQSRLLAIIGMAMKWQHHLGIIQHGGQFNVFRNTSARYLDSAMTAIKDVSKVIKFADKSHPECVTFTPNGQYLISGSSDGFIEVWNWSLGVLDTELEYQQKDLFMLHDTLITSLAVSRDSEVLASGDKNGNIKIWKIDTGECVRKILNAHSEAITSICFSRDSMNILTSSFDSIVRSHGLKSGKVLKEYRGHKSTVNTAIYSTDGTKVITGSSDGYVKVWDTKTCDCLKSFPAYYLKDDQKGNALVSVPINTIINFGQSNSGDLILVCTKSSILRVFNLNGQCIKDINNQVDTCNFIDVTTSKRHNFIYALGDDDTLYAFNNLTNKLEGTVKVHEREAIGIVHHPYDSVLSSWGLDSTIKLLTP